MEKSLGQVLRENRNLGDSITEVASEIFEACGSANDFCIQEAEALLFGSCNRLRLTAQGWEISESHCSADFIAKFREIYGKGAF